MLAFIIKNDELYNKTAPAHVIMYMKRTIAILLLLSACLCTLAQKETIMNKPFIDNRRLHWGFFFGMNFMDMEMKNNGHIDPATGEQWFADVSKYEPGFSVGVLLLYPAELREQPAPLIFWLLGLRIQDIRRTCAPTISPCRFP